MRTTVNLLDALFTQVKAHAAANGRTVTSLLEEALRDLLAKGQHPGQPVSLPTDGRPGGRFLIDILDHDAVAAALDADGFR